VGARIDRQQAHQALQLAPRPARTLALKPPPTPGGPGLLRPGAACCGLVQPVAALCSLLRPVAAWCSLLQPVAASFSGQIAVGGVLCEVDGVSMLRPVAACCSLLQPVTAPSGRTECGAEWRRGLVARVGRPVAVPVVTVAASQ
jgi:hypothetical protein